MIIEISMNFYTGSHSTDESETEEYMEFSKKIVLNMWQFIPMVIIYLF